MSRCKYCTLYNILYIYIFSFIHLFILYNRYITSAFRNTPSWFKSVYEYVHRRLFVTIIYTVYTHTHRTNILISKRRLVLLTFDLRRKILLRNVSEIKFYIILCTTAAIGLYNVYITLFSLFCSYNIHKCEWSRLFLILSRQPQYPTIVLKNIRSAWSKTGSKCTYNT